MALSIYEYITDYFTMLHESLMSMKKVLITLKDKAFFLLKKLKNEKMAQYISLLLQSSSSMSCVWWGGQNNR